MFVLMLMLVAVVAVAAPASATVHPIAEGDCSGIGDPFSPQGGEPPGISPTFNPVPGQGAEEARPIVAVITAALTHNLAAFNAANGDGYCPNGEPG